MRKQQNIANLTGLQSVNAAEVKGGGRGSLNAVVVANVGLNVNLGGILGGNNYGGGHASSGANLSLGVGVGLGLSAKGGKRY